MRPGTNAETFPHITNTANSWPRPSTFRVRGSCLCFFPRCSSFNSHYKGCVRAYRLAACNAVHFTFTAGGWGQCGMLMVCHSVFWFRLMGAAPVKWDIMLWVLLIRSDRRMCLAQQRLVPQEVLGKLEGLKDAGVCKWGWPLIQLCWLLL